MRPSANDYAPYYSRYIDLIEGENILHLLNEQSIKTQQILNSFPEWKGNYAYADGKWTVKQVIGHLMDVERIMAYRALCIARNEKKPLPSMEQDDYVREGKFNERELFDLNYEFRLIRETNMLLFKSFDEEVLRRKGIAAEKEVSVLALLFIIAGHEKHHIDILKEKYL